MSDQPTSLRDVISGLVSITHSEKMKKEFLDAAEQQILAWIKAKAPKKLEKLPYGGEHALASANDNIYAEGFNAGVDAFLEALEAKDVED